MKTPDGELITDTETVRNILPAPMPVQPPVQIPMPAPLPADQNSVSIPQVKALKKSGLSIVGIVLLALLGGILVYHVYRPFLLMKSLIVV